MEPRILEFVEYEPFLLEKSGISENAAAAIFRKFGSKLTIESPGPATDQMWRLISNGWVGHLPVSNDLALSITPRVPLANIFRMLEYAYNVNFELYSGMTGCASLRDFYERLANVLAKRVVERARKGLYREYLEWAERLSCMRGRVDVRRAVCRPWDPNLDCRYEEHTADILDNQILHVTLGVIARSGLCSERVLPTVRKAYRALGGKVTPATVGISDCLGRIYNRLNHDYRPMHAICRFFLEHTGPTHQSGGQSTVPFAVHMPTLYEKFVAEWLRIHMSDGISVHPQYKMTFGEQDEVKINIDLLLKDIESGEVVCVLDTKYKIGNQATAHDVEQVVAYATGNRCSLAMLVYPRQLKKPLNVPFGDVRVASAVFELDGDLDIEGQSFSESVKAAICRTA
jgi:5-methylcytosine-specific restriction enzyme subunit McrC